MKSLPALTPVKKNKQRDGDEKEAVCHKKIIDYLTAPGLLSEENLN